MVSCILKPDIQKVRAAIAKNGGMGAFRKMETKARIDFLSEYVDMPGHKENAQWLNKELERRLLKPAQIAGAKEWLNKISKKGLPDTSRKAILDRISEHKDIMNPKGKQPFMESLAKQVMGFELSRETAQDMFKISQTINQLKKNLLTVAPEYYSYTRKQLEDAMKDNPDLAQARKDLGLKLLEFQNMYEAASLEAQIAELAQKGTPAKVLDKLSKIAGNIKSTKASFDISFLRQLQSVAYVDWASFAKAWKSGFDLAFTKGDVSARFDTVMADILTRPNALNGNYRKFGVDIGMKEEAFPESWAEKNINVGQLFTRSEKSFNVAIQSARAELFDTVYEKNVNSIGVDETTRLLTDQKVGEFVNVVTGRGKVKFLVSKDEKQNKMVNNLLFAPKWLASRIETVYDARLLVMPETYKHGKYSPQALRARNAAVNLGVMMALVPAIKALLWAGDEDDNRDFGEFMQSTFDPRSSDFGKIVVGTTRFDITTGTAALITLMSRITTRKTVDLSGVERDTNWSDVVSKFLEGKASPGIRVAYDAIYAPLLGDDKTLMGDDTIWKLSDKTTREKIEHVASGLMDFVAPIFLQSLVEVGISASKGEADWAMAGGVLADFAGIAANTYDTAPKDMGKSAKALKVEKQVAFATNKAPISSKLSNNVTIFRGRSDEEIRKIREEFARDLGKEEDKLINTAKFKKADATDKSEMLKAMRKKLYAKYKTKYPPKTKKPLNKKTK